MEKYAILLGYMDKQAKLIRRLYNEVKLLQIDIYEFRYVFALKTQQLYTAIEDLLKQIAKAFENHIQDMSVYHKELLIRLNTEIPKIRPAFLCSESFYLLDKIRVFRHFVRHAYDCELDELELSKIQERLNTEFHFFEEDLETFRSFVVKLSSNI